MEGLKVYTVDEWVLRLVSELIDERDAAAADLDAALGKLDRAAVRLVEAKMADAEIDRLTAELDEARRAQRVAEGDHQASEDHIADIEDDAYAWRKKARCRKRIIKGLLADREPQVVSSKDQYDALPLGSVVAGFGTGGEAHTLWGCAWMPNIESFAAKRQVLRRGWGGGE